MTTTVTIAAESRETVVKQEDRTSVIPIENRSYTVKLETRSVDALTVKSGSTISLLKRMAGGYVKRMDGGHILLNRY